MNGNVFLYYRGDIWNALVLVICSGIAEHRTLWVNNRISAVDDGSKKRGIILTKQTWSGCDGMLNLNIQIKATSSGWREVKSWEESYNAIATKIVISPRPRSWARTHLFVIAREGVEEGLGGEPSGWDDKERGKEKEYRSPILGLGVT